MATDYQIITKKMLVPHSKLNGLQTYKDFGVQYVTIIDCIPAIPQVIFTGMTLSGEFEIPPLALVTETHRPGDPSEITGEEIPEVRDEYGHGEDATGFVD